AGHVKNGRNPPHSSRVYLKLNHSPTSYRHGARDPHPLEFWLGVMDTNALIDIVHEVTGYFCQWVSTFHPDKLPCQLDGTFHHGAYNAGMKMVFTDNTAWKVHFPRVGMTFGMTFDDSTDEKVAMEVTASNLIRNTTIPVPRVQVWLPLLAIHLA
ncbi:hypothetical protein N7517_010275, partial [Penicillium concentricum]